MIYRRRKHSECLNCRAKLDSVYNYCPLCGQENTDNKVNFKTLVGDFFNNYLSLDSRFGKSIKPFLLKPGLLTNEFIVGHRVSFMHPIRLYLVMSLFYFFVISLPGLRDENADQKEDTGSVELSPNINTLGDRSSSLLLSDSLIASNDTIVDTKQGNDADSLDTEFWIFTSDNANIFNDMRLNREFSDQQLLDSLNTDEMSFWEVILAKQLIRVARSESQNLTGYIIKNLPVMMFFMLPVFALILHLFYRKNHLYIEHLVHAFHIHSFFYFIFGIAIFIYKIILPFNIIDGLLLFISVIWVIIYVFKSYRIVYRQKWLITFAKYLSVGFIYNIFLCIAFLVELTISLLIY